MLTKVDQVLTKALLGKSLISREKLEPLLEQAQSGETSLLSLIISRNIISEEEALKALADVLGVEYIIIENSSVSKQAIEKVPVKIASYYKFFPLKLQDRALTIAVSYPLDVKTEDEIRMQLGFDINYVLTPEEEVLKMLRTHYGAGAETIGQIMLESSQDEFVSVQPATSEKIDNIEKQAQEASVIKLVNQILFDAYKRRATDIHIEPYRDRVRLRYRTDGVLYDSNVSGDIKRFIDPILSRIKIMANLNIVEHRLAQDGRAVVKTQDQVLDLRVSFIPTPYGESVVIRILPAKMLFSLSKLGLSSAQLDTFGNLIAKPHGIIFVTGPTGSGKTTTLYACLSQINTNERKIITIEDPIEYEMEGITQIQVMPEIGWTFSKGLRSMLRHDPDVMMVGEVRDLETAEIAIRVALTGHLVFSTLHTNDAASGITRLIDIGLEPYLVASSVEAFIAQRLIRVICPGCKKEIIPSSDDALMLELRKQIAVDLGLLSVKEVKLYKGEGCSACNMTGFFGRTAIYEILLVNGFIRELIIKKASASQIKKIAISHGMKTLRQDGWMKVMQGITTIDEVVKVTQAEEIIAQPVSGKMLQETSEGSFGQRQVETQPLGSSSDKRIYVRLESRVDIKYKVFKSLEELTRKGYQPENFTVTRNISGGGLLFLCNEPVPVGGVAELKLELPDLSEAISCLAKVVRVEELEPNKKYNIAVQFLDITSADRARLNKFILE